MNGPTYNDTKINPRDVIDHIRDLSGSDAEPCYKALRDINPIVFDSGFSAALSIVWAAVLDIKRATYNEAAVKHNASVAHEYERVYVLERP